MNKPMIKIESVRAVEFTHPTRRSVDAAGHSHPGPLGTGRLALLSIRSTDGVEGHCFAPPQVVRPHVLEQFVRRVLVGGNALNREKLWCELEHWQRGSAGQLTDRALGAVDSALWDLIGRTLGTPVYQLLGGYRDKVPAYGSTMCGDELKGGLSTPEEYADFALQLVERGYKAIKLHTWMPPVSFAPDPGMDIKACTAVRRAVGPDIELMLDGYHEYSRTDALRIGRALEELGFAWFEEMMNEQSTASYAWLADQLDVPILGPESLSGKHYARAGWVTAGASDILRAGVTGCGGIGPTMKVAALAESFGMNCEVHGNGAPNLAVCGAIRNCRWYERGLLHPFLDYEEVPAYLNALVDPMDANGFVALPQAPGLGEDINFDYIARHTVATY
ncbi:MAG: mandelate racemase family protein [Pelomonas sp.]|nr:mandelate racemase family protein [Roseateles sp.]